MAKRAYSKPCRGYMTKMRGKRLEIPANGTPPQVFALRGDALVAKEPGEAVVRVEIRELP